MPIHDQGYRRYSGARILRARSWFVIARAGIIERLRERRFLALLLVAWLLFVVRAVQIYFGTTFVRASFFAPSEETFHGFLTQQRLFVFFITIYAGAGLIASDRQANALQLYLSKPITRHDYIVGKLATLAAFLIAVTWVPAMMLLMLQVLFSGSLEFVSTHPRLVPAITITAALQGRPRVDDDARPVVAVAKPEICGNAVRARDDLRRHHRACAADRNRARPAGCWCRPRIRSSLSPTPCSESSRRSR
jgi:hypothetical protein